MTKRYLITGGVGFIGCNYVHRVLSRGETVTVYDNLSRRGAEANVAWLREQHGAVAFQLIVGDVRDYDALAEATRSVDVVVHLAGQTAVTTSVADPRSDFEDNALGTFNALEAARHARGAALWFLDADMSTGTSRSASRRRSRSTSTRPTAARRGLVTSTCAITPAYTGCRRWCCASRPSMAPGRWASRTRAGWPG